MSETKGRRCHCGRHMMRPNNQPAGVADLDAHCPACDRLLCGNCRCRVADPKRMRCQCGRSLSLGNRQP